MARRVGSAGKTLARRLGRIASSSWASVLQSGSSLHSSLPGWGPWPFPWPSWRGAPASGQGSGARGGGQGPGLPGGGPGGPGPRGSPLHLAGVPRCGPRWRERRPRGGGARRGLQRGGEELHGLHPGGPSEALGSRGAPGRPGSPGLAPGPQVAGASGRGGGAPFGLRERALGRSSGGPASRAEAGGSGALSQGPSPAPKLPRGPEGGQGSGGRVR